MKTSLYLAMSAPLTTANFHPTHDRKHVHQLRDSAVKQGHQPKGSPLSRRKHSSFRTSAPAAALPREGQSRLYSSNVLRRLKRSRRASWKRPYLIHSLMFAFFVTTLSGIAVFSASWTLSRGRAHSRTPSQGLSLPAAGSTQALTVSSTSSPSETIISVIANVAKPSPMGVSWGEVLTHTAQRLQWSDSSFVLRIHDVADVEGSAAAMERLAKDLIGSQITVLVGVHDPSVSAALADLLREEPTVLALGSAPELGSITRLGGRSFIPEQGNSLWSAVAGLFSGSSPAKQDSQVYATVTELFDRNTSDDFLFVFLVLINQYVKEVPLVSNSTKSQKAGLPELQCMISNCGAQILSCYADTSCRTALNCLNQCHFNDQVCSYRCIASYESPQLADFSLCVLQKHNCLGLSAEIPQVPDPSPLPSFNGQAMTHELAEDLFIGWLRDPSGQLVQDTSKQEVFSWRVFSGKNPAYDYFPCQFQLFYRGKAQRSMWYDPVFKVKTLDGRLVWRRRHYRVRRGSVPGTFNLSVLDNGVTSREFWRILDCAEDLEWCAFYYSGAAAAAGTSYTGAILASKSGEWPDASQLPRIEKAMESAGIKMWELSSVDNSMCSDAPLDPQLMAMA